MTDRVAAMKNRPRSVAIKPEMSISSRPMRKKKRKIPMPSSTSSSFVGSMMPKRGPSASPAAVYATIALSRKRRSTPSSSFATTMSSPMDRSTWKDIPGRIRFSISRRGFAILYYKDVSAFRKYALYREVHSVLSLFSDIGANTCSQEGYATIRNATQPLALGGGAARQQDRERYL